jgi:putative hydrolase of the HAD superfamily
MSDVQAVIWDFGGVISSSPFEAFNAFEQRRGLPRDFIRTVNATNHLDNAWALLERNAVTKAQFDQQFADESRALGYEVRGADVIPLLYGVIRPQMVEALRRIHARLKTGCITNNFSETAATPSTATTVNAVAGSGHQTLYKESVMVLFHHVIESAKTGLRKPDPRIYSLMTDALQVEPTQCVYLDDLGVNLKPARDMGMKTIKVGEPGPALEQLEALVGFALR